MASALLASRNEPCWGDRKVYMRKNPNPKLCPNPNPNPNFNLISNGHEADDRDPFLPMESDEAAPPHVAATAVSDDSSCFNRKPAGLGHRRDSRGYVAFNISTYSKLEVRELKRRLLSELEQVRSVSSRIESREVQCSFRSAGYSTSSAQAGGREASTCPLPEMAGSDNLVGRSAPNANQLYHPADTKKRPVTDALAAAPEMKKVHTAMMKKCSQILTKLMKHKGGAWFNTPVDVVRMGLHDYHQIVKNPMDLGTVKSKLVKGHYRTPSDFASDIRLTFNNALVYNPQGHVVHSLAGLLLRQFEDSFGPAYDRYERQRSSLVRKEEEGRRRHLNYSRSVAVHASVTSAEPFQVQTPEPEPSPPPLKPQPNIQQQPPAMMVPKQPKPKANGTSKRAMTMEEKQNLGAAIQNLPEEKMTGVLEIVSKRNVTERNGDEVEIDFEIMDDETLWELDRFVANWNNKMVSKVRKQTQETLDAGDGLQDPLSVPAPHIPVPSDAGNKSPAVGEAPEAFAGKRMKKGEPVEEEVDIGEEMPANHYPPVEIGKAESSSGSSNSDSSSSSGSESESSSGRSDAEDEARSPAVNSRRSPRS